MHLAFSALPWILAIIWALQRLFQAFGESKKDYKPVTQESPKVKIQPLSDFDFRAVDPTPHRPWKTMAHVSMGINKVSIDEWIAMDKGYLKRLEERKMVMDRYPKDVFGTGPIVNPAIRELYEEVMAKYLPQRYPTMFQRRNDTLVNLITGARSSLDLSKMDEVQMLRNLAENVEEDFYIMCPDEADDIRLQGYIACFPGGFLSPSRVGQSMREIHDPVPGYQKRLARGADAYLQRLGAGSFINRMNWSLQVDGADLFRVDGNNFYPEQGQVIPEDVETVSIAESYLRVERQTLTRLARSRAVIFTVRSYMTPLSVLKKAGEGPELAAAIRSMPEKLGNYKKRPFWAEEVYAYLEGGQL